MNDSPNREASNDHSLLLGLFMLFLLSSPILTIWASSYSGWYLPYLVWFGIILIIAWVHERRRDES